ncbi:reverse transcriptase domain-containing protein [Tanacetum coccineum]
METCDPVGTPMEIKDKLELNKNGTLVDATKYHSMIGALMYLMSNRSDIVHATCLCARYQAKPTEKHLKEDSGFELTGFSDADYAGCKDTFKSTSSRAQLLGEKLVSWSSKKQDCTVLSTAEAEYVSLSTCCAQVIWMQTQLTDYCFHFNKISNYCDSKSVIAISYNPVQYSRTKHIAGCYHFIMENMEKGMIKLYFVKTDYQLADLFTKALPVDRFMICADIARITRTEPNTRQKQTRERKRISKSHQSEAPIGSKSKSVKSKPQLVRASRRKSSSDSGYDTMSGSGSEDLSMPYRRPKLMPFTSSAHIKGVPPVLRISAFIHGHGHPELAKKLNDKIPKTVDEMWERFRAFIRGETVSDTTKVIRSPRWEKSAGKASWRKGFTPLTKTPKEILAMDNVNFPPPPLMKQIEKAVALGRLAHLVKDIRQSGQKNKGSAKGKEKVINMVRSQGYQKRPYKRVEHCMDYAIAFSSVPRYQLMDCPVVVDAMIEGFKVRRIYVDGGRSLEIMYEHCFRNLSYRTRSRLRESQNPLVGFSGEVNYPLGDIDLEVTMVECERTRIVIMEFAVVKSLSMYNSLLGRMGMRSLGVVASTIHSMVKFPTSNGIATITTIRETLRDCKKIEEAQALSQHAHVTDPSPMQTSSEVTNPRVSLALTPADMTGIPRAIMEHILDTNPHIEPKVQKKRSLALDRRKVVTDEVNEWLKASIGYHQIRKTKKDEEKKTFHTEERVFCYTKMPFGLKNAGTTYQRLVDSAFKEQIGVNLEAINMKLNPKKCSFGMEEGKFLGYIVTSEGIRGNPKKTKAVMDMPSPKTLKKMQSLRATEAALLEMKKLVSELPTLTTLKKGETLMMYLATADEAVSAVLLTERDGRKMPIHYVSRSLQGIETNYSLMEKLTLALVYAARRLRRIAVKGQVLADFLVDASIEINVAPMVASTLRVEDILESSNAMEDLTPGPRAWRLYTDEASNNGGSRDGFILIPPDDVKYSYVLHLNFSNSNNDAEYEALLAGLRISTEMQVKYIHAFVDSKLVASQVEGSYEAKGERMIKYQEKVLELDGAFNRFRITRIPRVENRKADPLSKLAAVQFDHLSKEVLVEVLNKCSVEAQEVNMVVEEEGPTWITLIQNYLEKRMLPEDPVDARTLMEKIRNYTMEDGVLYRKSYLVLLMRCIWPLQANYVIREVRMGSCEMYDGLRQVVAKAINLGYYWPSMHRDARDLIRACDDCQAHASVPRLLKANMISVTLAWTFMKWDVDIVGPLPKGPGRVKYLIVATEYFTKWMEAKPLATITGRQGNGEVERENRSLLKGIKTKLEKGGSAWAEEVLNVLWAHQTMKKTNNGETPFSLTYELRLNLDLLEERIEIVAIREARYKQLVEKYYNKKVRHVQFKVGEFILRKNEASRAANTGKLGPTWEGPYKVIQAFQSGAYKLSNMEGEEIPKTWHACNLQRCYM